MRVNVIPKVEYHLPSKTMILSKNTIIIASQSHKHFVECNKARNSIINNNNILSFSLSISLALSTPLPCLALPSFLSPSTTTSTSSTTPFSQSKNLPIGLENGKIRACPSVNPSCVSTNPKSSNFDFPWQIPAASTQNAVQKLQEAILATQKNATIQIVKDTPNGQYLEAEVDGGFGRDVMEFLIRGEVATYRCMASKVTYIYPFTTAFGDSKGQQERMKKIVEELGWYAPSFDLMD